MRVLLNADGFIREETVEDDWVYAGKAIEVLAPHEPIRVSYTEASPLEPLNVKTWRFVYRRMLTGSLAEYKLENIR